MFLVEILIVLASTEPHALRIDQRSVDFKFHLIRFEDSSVLAELFSDAESGLFCPACEVRRWVSYHVA